MLSDRSNVTPCSFLLDAAREAPEAPAILSDDTVTTYATLARRAQRVAALLGDSIEPGERVALLMDNCAEYVCLYWGILLAGSTSVELNPTLSGAELCRHIQMTDASLCIAAAAYATHLNFVGPTVVYEQLAMTARGGSRYCTEWLHALADAVTDITTAPLATPTPLPEQRNLASIVFTSGTTGQVKGVELTHANLAWTTTAIASSFAMSRDASTEVVSGSLPLYYTYGKSNLHLATWLARPIVFSNQFPSPRNLVALFKRCRVTHAALVPYQCHLLLKRDDFCAESLPHMVRITVAGGGLNAATRTQLEGRFPGQLMVMYGLTEASTRVTCLANAGRHADNSCGQPLLGVEIRIDPLAPERHDDQPNGEILVRGANLMRGYFRDPMATAQAIRDGWLHTGDIGYLDATGALHVIGRLKEIIKIMGESIAAATVEEAIRALPEVADAAVIGVPHAQMGEAIHAFVCLHPGQVLSPEQVRQHCSQLLGRVRTPSQVSLVDEFPRTASGKVRKHLLGKPG